MKYILACVIVLFFSNIPVCAEEGGWVVPFNGENLAGWTVYCGQHEYTIEEGGVIVGTAQANTPNGFLTFEQAFHNFELEFEVKVNGGLNSGVQIRSQPREKDGHLSGPQVEVFTVNSGYVYGEALSDSGGRRRGWISQDRTPVAFIPDQWNRFRVVAFEQRYRIWINDVLIEDMEDELTNKSGLIGLQVHRSKVDKVGKQVRWRNIKVREIETDVIAEDVVVD